MEKTRFTVNGKPVYQNAPQCSACNRVAVQGVVRRRNCQ